MLLMTNEYTNCTTVVDFSFKYQGKVQGEEGQDAREFVFLYRLRTVLRRLSFAVLVYPEITFRTKYGRSFALLPDAWVVAVKKRRRTLSERASERGSEQSYGSTDDGAPSWSGLSVLHEVLCSTRA